MGDVEREVIIVVTGVLMVLGLIFGVCYLDTRATEKHRLDMVSKGCKLYNTTIVCEGKVQ
jgi:hypothetical protein